RVSDRIPEEKSNGTQKSIVVAGRLVREKGYDALIPMAADILADKKGWSLSIYGDGYERDKLSSLINEFSSDGNMRLRGFEKNLPCALSKSSIYLCTSHTESFGMAIAEAMACALPVVSFDCPTGPRDIIEDGKNGFLIPVGDRAAFIAKVKLLMRDVKLRKKMGAYARRSVERFLPGDVALRWENLFEAIRRDI
ncbi:MAG TPA: glycosyltransferase, partial [Spirochaetota bacterium]|nr:glycosyltransferase [Spirochaetota bacterium]